MSADVIIVTPDTVGPVKNGGIGTACFHYARSLARAGRAVDVLFTGPVAQPEKARWVEWYRSFGIGFLSLDDVPPRPKYAYGTAWFTERSWILMKFIEEHGYKYALFQDWHANGFWSARAKRMGSGFANTKIGVISHSPSQWQREGMESHGDRPLEEAHLDWAEREAIAAADVLVSPSAHMVKWLRSRGFVLPEEVALCPYTFEDTVHAPRPETLDRDHLIFFGRLETRKGLHVLADALRMLKAQGKPLPKRVSLLGKMATVQGIPSPDYIAAWRAEMPEIAFTIENDLDYLQAVAYIREQNGIVVIPSLLDNFPLTVVESIINGFCFFASTAGGIPEMIDPQVAFEANACGLMRRLESRFEIDWASVKHLYSPDSARETWLNHVERAVEEAQHAPPPARPASLPPISVCIPFYKHDRYFRRCVMSILRQEGVETQIVAVNDGTPEEEAVEFRRMKELFEPLGHVFHTQQNAGPGAARNKAVELAKHGHLLFIDSDNVPFPDMAARLMTAMLRTGADSVAAPFAAVPPMERTPHPSDVWFHFHPAGGPAVYGLFENVLGDAAALVKRDAFDAIGGFSAERGSWEDWDFLMRLLLAGKRHFVYPEVLLYYTHDDAGRNNSAKTFDNQRHLMSSVSRSGASPALSGLVEVLAREVLASKAAKQA